ncbi:MULTISPECIES: lipopolysaccharide biosynthesis protein [Sphingobium]|jgi:O-antigen/teichoic acid export membrane protein|uniref:Lipopolysaccharide biosynthesis protein n=1 Tax=Sphingobium limneticum TaxID=1007511 RepID=A0A5J5HYX7_9SPHN|nr:lipopolysaccharide biosynthesis protein [Sphingobium limneticum]KAA9015041.1 lipopolysaccharide biosynthesis protein [Sphingobium limneticum]KAA9017268.1 lipopolysaccharide biosynthesis protein [Sphingobium limneticum]KAA9027964.1 lipopolysaccharide biosynthesis protein [Sphingobium limneticum]MBU0933284.1 lipopolysaccharide biosynthesis protein [Alphaproteobacteria bacterium]
MTQGVHSSLATEASPSKDQDDIAALAKGGRTNIFGFLLRLAARLPFLFIAGRWYGAEALGRFAYAVLVVEFVAQIATLGLKRGLAGALSQTERPHNHVVTDAMVVTLLAALLGSAILIAFPQAMFPNSSINGLDRLLALVVIGVAGSDVALAACAYRFDVGATVRARSIIEPWTISIGAFAFAFYSTRDGLILSYAVSMIAAFVASIIPMIRHYGRPTGWRPDPGRLWRLARRNLPLAAADGVEWGSRRLDMAILGLFVSPAVIGIYYVAQQVASLPQKLKTSFDPILGPVITRNLAENNLAAIAKQVSQVGFWIIAAQAGIALALGIPGEAVMGLVGPHFVGGTGALAFLLLAEVVAATAVVSESALVYIARHRNLMISLFMIGLQAAFSFALIFAARALGMEVMWIAAAPALALCLALGVSAFVKARLLSSLLDAPINAWRWPLLSAAGVACIVGAGFVALPARFEWVELAVGVWAILGAYGLVIWRWGFGSDDRALFRKQKPA